MKDLSKECQGKISDVNSFSFNLQAIFTCLILPTVLTQILEFCRCRHGYFHVVNNDYTHWEMYAIGGSADPTINSQGNRYLAPTNRFAKEVNYKHTASILKYLTCYVVTCETINLTITTIIRVDFDR